MYDPSGNGIEKTVQNVKFLEIEPPKHLSGLVHRFLELKTTVPLHDDYKFYALPDACTYIIFDQQNKNITGITKLRTTSEEINIGKTFHYVNIRFLPGVWQGHTKYGEINTPYEEDLPLIKINEALTDLDFKDKQQILVELVEWLFNKGLIISNSVTEKIFANIENIKTVNNMANVVGVSSRQLQRVLKQTTGFTPHDFLKILRLQQSLGGNSNYTSSYADQSHFIRSFRKATGYTPTGYAKKFE